MGLAVYRYMNDIARPLETQRRQPTGSFAGSALPQPRGVLVPPPAPRGSLARWLRVSPRARSQRVSFASPFLLDGAGGDADSLAGHERMRAALGRSVAAVQAFHLVGEGAPNNGARGTS